MWNNIRKFFKSMFHIGWGSRFVPNKPVAKSAVQKIAPPIKANNKIRANAAKVKIRRARKSVNDSN
jgi:hypothetical protein